MGYKMDKRHFVIEWLFVIIFTCFGNEAFGIDEVSDLNSAITKKKKNWRAAENWISKLDIEQRKALCGILSESGTKKVTSIDAYLNFNDDKLPAVFDWRDHNGNWITPVKKQKG